jgi:hypothetical protein
VADASEKPTMRDLHRLSRTVGDSIITMVLDHRQTSVRMREPVPTVDLVLTDTILRSHYLVLVCSAFHLLAYFFQLLLIAIFVWLHRVITVVDRSFDCLLISHGFERVTVYHTTEFRTIPCVHPPNEVTFFPVDADSRSLVNIIFDTRCLVSLQAGCRCRRTERRCGGSVM